MSLTLTVAALSVTDGPVQREIDAFLAACPSSFAQQSTAWCRVITSLGADEPVWLGCRHGGRLVGVLSAYRFRGPLGAILCSMPQPGALGGVAAADGDARAEIIAALASAFAEHARGLGCDLATLISNPFWPDEALIRRHLRPDYGLRNELLALPLRDGLDEHGNLTQASASLRRNLRTAQAARLQVDAEQSESNLEDWIAIHRHRAHEIGATPLPETLFRSALAHMVPRGLAHFLFVRTADGEMAAGGLYLHANRVIDAYLPAIDAR